MQVQDSSVAAFLRSTPLITPSDLSTYFSAFPLPSFSPPTAFSSASSSPSAPPTLVEDVAQFVDLDRLEGADHMQLLMGSMMCWKWLAGCLRCIADVSSRTSRALAILLPSYLTSLPPSAAAASSLPLPNYTLTSLLTTLDALHAALQTFQHHLSSLPHPWAHPSCLAPGPEGDTCESVHLRWVTRVDREVDEARWLVFATAGEGLLREERRRVRVGAGARGEVELQGEGGLDGEGRIDVEWLRMCEGKVRKGLKLAAFYFNVRPQPLLPSFSSLSILHLSPSSLTDVVPVSCSSSPSPPTLIKRITSLGHSSSAPPGRSLRRSVTSAATVGRGN